MAKAGLAARRACVVLLGEVQGGRLLNEALPDAVRDLPPQERARAQRLATTVLRWMDRADRVLGPYLRQRPPERTLNILRLGTVEMAVEGAAPHGVVDAMVELAREAPASRRTAGLVNAVLRQVSEGIAGWDAMPLPRLPKKLRARLVRTYGKDRVAAMEAAHLAGAPLDLTPRDPAAASQLATAVGGTVLPTGSVRVPGQVQVSALPGYDAGEWWVQDAAAAIPARVLAARPGERVLDLCAAPGGKTMQLAAAGAEVTALDLSDARMVRLRENLERTGLTAELVVGDALEHRGQYDAVLLDAPCSATGTIRRHPDLPIAKREIDFAPLVELQARMLDHALTLLAPGGRLVFCTCSLFPEEGEAHVARLLAEGRARAEPEMLALPGLEPEWIGEEGLRLCPDYWPELGGMDGFFIAALTKPA